MNKIIATLALVLVAGTAQANDAKSITLMQNLNGKVGNEAMSKAIKAYKANDLASACIQAGIAKVSYLEAGFDKPYKTAVKLEKSVCNLWQKRG